MADGDPLEAEKHQILEYARSAVPGGSRIVELRWGVPSSDGVSLIAEMTWGSTFVVRLGEDTMLAYGRDAPVQAMIQRDIREALSKL